MKVAIITANTDIYREKRRKRKRGDYPGYGNRGRTGDRIYAGSSYRPEGAVYGYAADGG